MSSPPPPFPETSVHFSSSAFAERERVAVWRELIGRAIARIDLVPLPDVPFEARMSVRLMQDLVIAKGQGTIGATARTRELLTDGDDTLVFQVLSSDGMA